MIPQARLERLRSLGVEVGELVADKQVQYGDAASRAAEILRVLYPEGIPTHAFSDALLVVRVADKLCRISRRGSDGRDLGGESPWRDLAGYGLLGLAQDQMRGTDEATTREPATPDDSHEAAPPLRTAAAPREAALLVLEEAGLLAEATSRPGGPSPGRLVPLLESLHESLVEAGTHRRAGDGSLERVAGAHPRPRAVERALLWARALVARDRCPAVPAELHRRLREAVEAVGLANVLDSEAAPRARSLAGALDPAPPGAEAEVARQLLRVARDAVVAAAASFRPGDSVPGSLGLLLEALLRAGLVSRSGDGLVIPCPTPSLASASDLARALELCPIAAATTVCSWFSAATRDALREASERAGLCPERPDLLDRARRLAEIVASALDGVPAPPAASDS